MIELDTSTSEGARIRVIGVGGGGGNAINSMIERGLEGVDFIAANTDIQALQNNLAPHKVQVGSESTRGLGAGANPEVGALAVQESEQEIRERLEGSDMVFVTAGMGGGTGTGGAPVVASIARDLGALTVGIVTKPFQWEARKRMNVAVHGIEELRKQVDALIVIPNQKLMSIIDKHTTFRDAFHKVDDVLHNATRGIADIISGHGFINVDFADVKTIMSNTGDALMGTGVAKGEHRAVEAAQNAISSPLLDGVSINGARGILINVTGGENLSMFEIGEAVSVIEDAAGDDVNLIYGIVHDETMDEELMITVVATGFDREEREARPVQRPTMAAAGNAHVQQRAGVPHQQQPMRREEIQQEPTPAEAPRREMPSKVPSGTEELQKVDEPTIFRRGGAILINKALHQSRQNATEEQDNSQSKTARTVSLHEEANVSRTVSEQPAFLRKIMD